MCLLSVHGRDGIDGRFGDGLAVVFYFVGIDGARFKRPVEPGDQLILHTAMDRARAGIYKFNVKATVDDEVACEAVLMCTRRQVS